MIDIDRAVRRSKNNPYGELTVQLMDESEPDGAVVFKDKNGVEVMFMSRACYEALRAAKGE